MSAVTNMQDFFSEIHKSSHELRSKLENDENRDSIIINIKKNQAIDKLIKIILQNIREKITDASKSGKTRVALYTNIRRNNRKIEGFYIGWLLKQPEFFEKIKKELTPFTFYVKKFPYKKRSQSSEEEISNDNGNDNRENNHVSIYSDVCFVSWFKE